MTSATPVTSSKVAAPPRYRNAAEWLADLGDIPLERIIFDPWPGTATEADLLRKVEVDKQLCELIDGTLVEKALGWFESIVAMLLVQELLNFIRPRGLGAVSGEAGTLRIAKGLVRLPDIAFVSAGKLRTLEQLEPIPSLAPDLAVEVLSKSNTRREIERKIREYFAAGTKLVWIIDPATRTATSLTAPDRVEPIDANGLLRGGDVLPGFEISLADLFRSAEKMANGEK